MNSLTRLRIATMALLLVLGKTLVAQPAQLTDDQSRILETARVAALQYTQKLPDFICDQLTHREFSRLNVFNDGSTGVSTGGANVHLPDAMGLQGTGSSIIDERLTFFAQKEKYDVIAINGKKVSGIDHMQLAGALSAGEFGSALSDIFNPASHTSFTWEGTARLRGRTVDAFGFNVPKENGALVIHQESGREIYAGYSGSVFVDAETLEVLKISRRLDLPPEFPIKKAETTIDYTPIMIAGKSYTLPSHSEVRLQDSTRLYVNRIDFRNYHRFAAESTIHYGEKNPQQ